MNKKSKTGLIIGLSILAAVVLIAIILVVVIASSGDEVAETQVAEEYDQESAEEDYELYDDEEEETDDSDDEDEDAAEEESDKTWTVMIYMCGSNLESDGECGTDNLIEILNRENSDKVNVVVLTGGSPKWHMDEEIAQIDPDSLSYYRLDGITMNLEKTEPLRSMGDPETLKDFINWSTSEYPADRNMLVFWDHGGGTTSGVCFDDLFEGDSLTLPEIKQVVSEADVPFEVIGFDACLMATLETAEALQGYGHYMVASEEVEPGSGWDYCDFLSYLAEDTSMDGLSLGKRISDGFLDKCKLYEVDSMITLSVTDLTRIPALSSTYRSLSGELVLTTQDTESLRTVMQGATKAESYGGNSQSQGYSNLIDLGDLLSQTGDVLNQNSENVKNALKEAVCYEVHGSGRGNSNGLSVFYPLAVDEDEMDQYKACTDNTAFLEYISILLGDWDSAEWEKKWEEAWKEAYSVKDTTEGKYDSFFNNGQSIASDYNDTMTEEYYETVSSIKPAQKKDYNLKFSQDFVNNEAYQLKITSGLDMVSSVTFLLFYEDPDSGKYIYLGSDNSLFCDYDKGLFKEDFAGTWITIGGEFVYAELEEETDVYNLYTVPVLLNGEEKYLKAIYDYKKEEFSVLGAYDGMDQNAGYSGRDVKKLKDGDKLEFLFYEFDPDKEDDEGEMVSIGEIKWNKDTVMEDTEFEDAGFVYMFKIKSIFGDEDFGDPIYMTIKNGEISVY